MTKPAIPPTSTDDVDDDIEDDVDDDIEDDVEFTGASGRSKK